MKKSTTLILHSISWTLSILVLALIVGGIVSDSLPTAIVGIVLVYPLAASLAYAWNRIRFDRSLLCPVGEHDILPVVRDTYLTLNVIGGLTGALEHAVDGSNEMSTDDMNECIGAIQRMSNDAHRQLDRVRYLAMGDSDMEACVKDCDEEFTTVFERIDKVRAQHNEMLLLEFEANGADPEVLAQMRHAAAHNVFLMRDTGGGDDADDDERDE